MIPSFVSDYLRRNHARYSVMPHPRAHTAQREAGAVADFASAPSTARPSLMVTAVDPVCGAIVGERDTAARSEHRGDTYYFCSQACKMNFDDNPDGYA